MKTGEYFIIREGLASYLCRKKRGGCDILAQLGVSGQWIRYRKPQFWRWFRLDEKFPEDTPEFLSREPKQKTRISKERVTAILLMGKNESSL